MEQLSCKALKKQEKMLVCDKHGSYMAQGVLLVMWHLHRMSWSECPACEKEQAQLEEQKLLEQRLQQEQKRWNALLGRSCLPKRFVGKTLANYECSNAAQQQAYNKVKDYAYNFEQHALHGEGLIFLGRPGTGKSHLAAALIQHIMPHYLGLYSTVGDCIRAVRGAWCSESNLSEQQVLNRFIYADLLVLDEVGVQYDKESERIILFDILDGRYRERMPTILMGNLGREELNQMIGLRAYDRLKENSTALLFDWESYRGA